MKPHIPLRPRRPVKLPISFGVSKAGAMQCESVERIAHIALFDGTADEGDLGTLTASCGAAINALRLAIKRPKHHTLDPQALPAALEVLYEHARALHSIQERAERLGKVGMSGPERVTLESLVNDVVEVRQAVTRRLFRDALDLTLVGRIDIPAQEEGCAA